MPRIIKLNKILNRNDRFKSARTLVGNLNSSFENYDHSSNLFKHSDEYKISSTVQCRTRALKTLKYLFEITNIDSENNRLEGEKILFGVPKPEFASGKSGNFPIGLHSLKELDKNKFNSSRDLYVKQFKARISVLVPQCSPKQVAVILSKFLQSNIDDLLPDELENLYNIIVESNMNLSSTVIYNSCIGSPVKNAGESISSLITKISRYISSKDPNMPN